MTSVLKKNEKEEDQIDTDNMKMMAEIVLMQPQNKKC